MIYYVNILFAIGIMLFPQNHSKMKHKISNIALEGTYSGDVVGGLLLWTVENLQALLFLIPRDRRVRPKRTSLVPARGLTSGRK